MATLHCDFVTPEGVAFTGEVERVTVPGANGEMGVLARHTAIVAALGVGETRVIGDGQTRRWATSQGHFKMARNRALVLVEGAVAQDAIDVEATRAAAADAKARLDRARGGDDTVDRFRAERDLELAENQLRVAAH